MTPLSFEPRTCSTRF